MGTWIKSLIKSLKRITRYIFTLTNRPGSPFSISLLIRNSCLYSHLRESCILILKKHWINSNLATLLFMNECIITLTASSVVYWSDFLATDSEVRIRFLALPDFQRSGGYGTGFSQPCEYNRAATWKKSSASSVENLDYGRRGSTALTTLHTSLRKSLRSLGRSV
jgi:hypothetical protein